MPGSEPLFLGVDGGGTKTDLLLAGADGAPVRGCSSVQNRDTTASSASAAPVR